MHRLGGGGVSLAITVKITVQMTVQEERLPQERDAEAIGEQTRVGEQRPRRRRTHQRRVAQAQKPIGRTGAAILICSADPVLAGWPAGQ
jgi:hypothetical protein